MGHVKRKGSNAGKASVLHLQELKQTFLKAEVLMKDIADDSIFNWNQIVLKLVSGLCTESDTYCPL